MSARFALALVLAVALLAGCQPSSHMGGTQYAIKLDDEFWSKPADTPEGRSDTSSSIHDDIYPEGRAARELKVSKAIAAEVSGRGLLNPGKPLADLDTSSTQSLNLGRNIVNPTNGGAACRIVGFVSCGFARAHMGMRFKLPTTVEVVLNGQKHDVPLGQYFALTVDGGVKSLIVVVPPSPLYRYALGEMRAYRPVLKKRSVIG